MTHSLVNATQLTCRACQKPFTVDLWLIIDEHERPDLIELVRIDELHGLTCPHCGDQGQLDAPLLIYRPQAAHEAAGAPPLIFSPARRTTDEQDQQHAEQLLGLLANSLGDVWQDAWMEQMAIVPRHLLVAVLSDVSDSALRDLAGKMRREVEQLASDDNSPFGQLQEAMRQAMLDADFGDEDEDENAESVAALEELLEELAEEGIRIESQEDLERLLIERPDLAERVAEVLSATTRSVIDALEKFLRADSWLESYRVVLEEPELLSEEADDLLGEQIAEAQARNDQGFIDLFEEHRALLRHCREVGVEEAFAEKMEVTVEELLEADH